jgi:hypothetical protein
MGSQLIGDPGAQESEAAEIGMSYIQVVNGDTVSLPIGTLVEIITPFDPTSQSFQVKRSATTADFLLLGIVSGQAIAVGGSGRVTVEGVASALFDAATTAGDVVTQSTGTAGECKDNGSTVVAGKTIGVVLKSNAVSPYTSYIYIHKV